MAKRIAQVDIKIGGIKTIADLEKELARMNEQVKELEMGSEAFKQLQKEIADTEGQLKTMNTAMEGVTSTEAAEGALKLGEGIAGAAIAVQGLTTFLGKNNEELEQTIQKVGGLILVLDGFRRATEAVSAENMKRLRGLGRMFTRLGASIKAAFAANPIVLITAAVAALSVVVVGLIRNWDRMGSVIKHTFDGSRREMKKTVKEMTKLKEAQDEIVAGTQAEATARQELLDYNEDYRKSADAAMAAQIDNIAVLETEIKLLNAQIGLNFQKIEGMRESRKKYKEIKNDLEAQQAQMNALIAQLELERERLNQVGNEWNNVWEIVANTEAQRRLENILKTLGGYEFTAKQIYEQEVRKIELQRQQIELTKQSNGEYRKGQKEQLDALNAEYAALVEKERIRRRDLEISIEELDRGKDYEALQKRIAQSIAENSVELERISTVWQDINIENEAYLSAIEQEFEIGAYILEQRKAMLPFDKKGLEILYESLGVSEEQLYTIQNLVKEDEDIFDLSQKVRLEYQFQLDELRAVTGAKQNILETDKEIVQENIKALQTQEIATNQLIAAAATREEVLQREKESYEASLATAKNREEEFFWMQKIEKVDGEIIGLQDEQNAGMIEVASLQNQIAAQKNEILVIDDQIYTVEEERIEGEKRISYELEQQLRLSSRMKTFVEEYNAEIQAGMDVMNSLFEYAAARQDELAAAADRRIAEAQEKLDALNKQQEKHEDKLKDLQDELQDADGERYDELLRLIKEEQDAQAVGAASVQQQIADEEQALKDAENAKLKAEYNAAKIRKKQALIDAAIQTALAVIKALPNVVLSIAAGVAGAAGIATIASQKIPPPQYLAEGGLLDGASHSEGGIPIGNTGLEVEGGEYVINKNSTSAFLPLLEALNAAGRTKYAEGGQLPTVNTAIEQEFIDYEKLSNAILRGIQPRVAVVDILTGMNKVKVIQDNASL